MLKKAYRTATTRIKPGPLAQAFEALELAGKNLRNTGVFLVKNVRPSFRKNEAGIYANPKQAVAEIERAIDACNATRRGHAPPPSPERGQGVLPQASDAHPKAGFRRVLWARSGPPVGAAARRLERSLQHPAKSHAGVLAGGLGAFRPA